MADGAIVIFSEKYNIGRLNAINDEYFNGDLSQTIDISDVVGAGMGGNGSAGNGGSGSENQGSPGTPATQPSPSNSAPTPIPVKQPIVSSTMNPANRPTESPNSASNVAMTSGQQAQGTGSNTNASPSPRPACPKPCQNGGTCTFKGTCYCSNGWSGPYCEITTTPTRPPQLVPDTGLKLARKEMIVVKLIWGVEPVKKSVSDLWLIERKNTPPQEESPSYFGKQALPSIPGGVVNSFDLSEPQMQEWLLKVVKLARADDKLNVQPKVLTWIEMFHDVAIKSGVGFPVPKDLFAGYLQLLKSQNRSFFTLIKKEIGTRSPGLAGDFLFASITLHADVLRTNGSSLSMTSFKGWSSFAENVNELSPPGIPQMLAQSDTFLNAYRAEKTIDSTVTTWFVANGLCMAIILLFTQNVLLCAMVMVSIILIFLCLVGLVFAVFALPFGPVEALGISIFIGLSANYSLHLVHAYHRSSSSVREEKAKQAIFVTGSPILASALSTIGGSMFLFACRTWAFVELGILLCSIILMALLFSMTFLLAWLATKGPTPLPCEEQDKNKQRRRLHSCDLKALCYSSFRNFAGIKIGEKERPLSEVSKDYDGSANEEEPSICDSDVETSRKVERYPGRQ